MTDADDVTGLVLIVTGAHLAAERYDRPLAYRLRETMLRRLDVLGEPHPFDVLVCSDLWYLNDDALRAQPTISVGGPSVNALAAFLADRVESAFVVEDVLSIQLDLEFVDAVASCWGVDPGSTVSAVDAFVERYLDLFIERSAARLGA